MKLGESVNEFGTAVSVHICETCGQEFTCCPARPDDNDNWKNCLSVDCSSYDIMRDADLAFDIVAAGGIVFRESK